MSRKTRIKGNVLNKTDISSFDKLELKEYLKELGERKNIKIESFRADQIFDWLVKGAGSFYDMLNVPKTIKQALNDDAFISLPVVEKKLVSKLDGTVKYLFRLHDGECVESVFMKYEHGNTVCISTQVGCRMGCTFCASTLCGKTRDLLASEMTGQVIAVMKDLGQKVSNIVMMGIGEPLDNYDNVLKFLHLVNLPEGLSIGHRHISLSTCGLCDKMRRLADQKLQITLSVSLHASDNDTRAKLMPVARKYDLDELIDTCKYYIQKTNRRISFEYSMIHGQNDTPEHAKRLAKLLQGMLCHVNLIPLNDVKERNYIKSTKKDIDEFVRILEKSHITATVRRRLGSDINASCGQLRASSKKESGDEQYE